MQVFRGINISFPYYSNGPIKACYNWRKFVWFDFKCFEDWFKFLLLSISKNQNGKKVITGHNLSSHINIEVMNLCQENKISFKALPPIATHLLVCCCSLGGKFEQDGGVHICHSWELLLPYLFSHPRINHELVKTIFNHTKPLNGCTVPCLHKMGRKYSSWGEVISYTCDYKLGSSWTIG